MSVRGVWFRKLISLFADVPDVAPSSPCGSSSHWGPSKPLGLRSSASSQCHCAPAARLRSWSQGWRVSSTRSPPRHSPLLFLFLLLPRCPCLLPELVSRSSQIPQWGFLLPGSPWFLIWWSRGESVYALLSKCPTSSSESRGGGDVFPGSTRR